MKKLLFASFFTVMLSLLIGGCKKEDDMDPVIEGLSIDNYDLIQLTNENPDLPVSIAYNDDRSIDSVAIKVSPMGGTTVVARNVIRNITHSNSGRTLVKTPFPAPNVAPSGVYTIEYTITDRAGKTSTKSYNVNIPNNKVQNICTFPSMTLPAGKNVWIRVSTTMPLAANENIYITGSFEAANGGAGDWTGGNVPMFKLNRLSGSNQCFYIALNLDASSRFKFTLGDWNQEALDNTGGTPSDAAWNDQSTQDITIFNWKGKPVVTQVIPQVLPGEGIATGNMSVIADVNNTDDAIKYFLVPKGGSLTDQSRPMYRVKDGANNTTKVIGSVPKSTTVEYLVVRNIAGVAKKGVNPWGFEITAKWDGITNPVTISTPYFEGDAGISVPPANLYIVGGATPDGWSNPPPSANQKFVQTAPGKFQIASIALTSGQAYLLLPEAGNWNLKYGGSGKLGGAIVPQGPDIPSPDAAGNYKIVVDFTTGAYTLTKL